MFFVVYVSCCDCSIVFYALCWPTIQSLFYLALNSNIDAWKAMMDWWRSRRGSKVVEGGGCSLESGGRDLGGWRGGESRGPLWSEWAQRRTGSPA
jgi:hypothetical protein